MSPIPRKMIKFLVLASLFVATRAISYTVTVKTSNAQWADTNGKVYAAAIGSNGKMVDLGPLDNPK